MVANPRPASSRHAAVRAAAKVPVVPDILAQPHMLEGLRKDGFFKFVALSESEVPWAAADLDKLKSLTRTTKKGKRGRAIAGFAFNTKDAEDAGDGSRRLAFLRNVTSRTRLPSWLIPLFEAIEKRVMLDLPYSIHDSSTRSVYFNVDSVPANGADAFNPASRAPRVLAAGNPPHVDIKEFDDAVLECVGSEAAAIALGKERPCLGCRHVSAGRLPPVAIFFSLEGFSMRVWPGGHEALRRDALHISQRDLLPLPDKELRVLPGECLVVRFDSPHAGGTTTNVRLCTVVGNESFPRPKLEDESAYEDNVNFGAVMERPDLFMNAEPKRSAA